MKALICDKCGAPMKRGASECEYCGTQYEDEFPLTEEKRREINECTRCGAQISFDPIEDVIFIRTEEEKRKLLMDAAYLSPLFTGDGYGRYHGKKVIWEVEA